MGMYRNEPVDGVQAEELVDAEGHASEGYQKDLKADDDDDDDWEEEVVLEALEDVHLIVDLSGVEEVEHLQHHESVEDEGPMPGENFALVEDLLIVGLAVKSNHSA